MKKWLLVAILAVVMVCTAQAQENYTQFKSQINGYYHNIVDSDVQNFSCLITSAAYIDFIDDHADSSFYYPLKITWLSDGSSYYALQPFPALPDSIQRKTFAQAQALKDSWSYIFPDLNKFVFYEPLHEVPDNATLTTFGDTIGVAFRIEEKAREVKSKQTFTKGGMLGRVIWFFNERKEVYYPTYKKKKKKWLCLGWDGQVLTNNEVSSGLRTKIIYFRQNERFLPEQINLFVQTRTESGDIQTIPRVLFLKDYEFNQNVQVITAKGDSAAAAQEQP